MLEMWNPSRVSKVNRIFISWLIVNLVGACRSRSKQGVVVRYRCEEEDTAFRNISIASREDCTLLCTQTSNCVQINYNRVNKYCLLFSNYCTLAQPVEEVSMLRFVDDLVPRDECIHWIPFTGTLPSSGVVVNGNHLMARGTINSKIIPGKLYKESLELWSVHNGERSMITDNIEYLDIHPSCFGVWVPYSAGLGVGLPTGAVRGGVLTSGLPLYVARAVNSMSVWTSMGYYDPDRDLAIITNEEALTRTEMDILVLVWLRYIVTWNNKCNLTKDNVTHKQLLINSAIKLRYCTDLRRNVLSEPRCRKEQNSTHAIQAYR